MALTFHKYQGLGNDFVVIEAKSLMEPERARRLCDRRRGIGADGVLTLLPAKAAGAAAFMHIYNSDGSVAAMCGNGVRCVARHLAETRGLQGEIDVETAAGLRRCTVHGRRGAVESITVTMGPARDEGEQLFVVGSEKLLARRISMGNPHAVIFGDSSTERAAAIGPTLEAAVPGGVNVGFAARGLDGLDLVVWERGAGLTEACGTGACAAAAAAVLLGIVDPAREVEVRLPGGPLQITLTRDLSSVRMRGPAERVFSGETDL
ncbi:MAG TPA: diaminopimelate epimerase [Anaeromyxobacteraceae bacterium]|jgi:diaminopimelate epimerase|nr:diaminopimelate epimerase [Anaeromyxobacteraceae bacterium]